MYGAWVNLGGLGVDSPVKLRKSSYADGDYNSPQWWVDEGDLKDDFDFEKVGLHVQSGCVRFASKNKKEVQAFINGVRAVATTLFSGVPKLEVEPESENASLS